MESAEIEIELLRKMTVKALSECTDADLIDLVYKLLITQTSETGRA